MVDLHWNSPADSANHRELSSRHTNFFCRDLNRTLRGLAHASIKRTTRARAHSTSVDGFYNHGCAAAYGDLALEVGDQLTAATHGIDRPLSLFVGRDHRGDFGEIHRQPLVA